MSGTNKQICYRQEDTKSKVKQFLSQSVLPVIPPWVNLNKMCSTHVIWHCVAEVWLAKSSKHILCDITIHEYQCCIGTKTPEPPWTTQLSTSQLDCGGIGILKHINSITIFPIYHYSSIDHIVSWRLNHLIWQRDSWVISSRSPSCLGEINDFIL